jgi:hypothetical protein
MSTSRHFLQTGSAMLTATGLAAACQGVSPSDRIRIVTIGFGGMGMGDAKYALSVPGVELAAVCDIYDGRPSRFLVIGAGEPALNSYIPETVRKCLTWPPDRDTGVNQLPLFT